MKTGELTGIYQASGRGYGFFVPAEGDGDWFVPPRREGNAWDGDTVAFRPAGPPPPAPGEAEGRDGRRRAGEVTAVLERANRTVVGTVRKQGRQIWLAPDNPRLPPVLVLAKAGRAGGGDKAAVRITSFGGRGEPPTGRLAETFGRAGTRQAAVDAVLYQHDIWNTFPPDVLAEAEQAAASGGPREAAQRLSGERTSTGMSEFSPGGGNEGYGGCEDGQADQVPRQAAPDALEGRRDLRGETVITIDGASAKDLDDAVSLKRDGAGGWVLGVHIADVSHYVRAGSLLDREAWERGTSVYFADRVVPMLPPALSNGICSLHPHVDRLTLSCIMKLKEDGTVDGYEIVQSVIRSAERMTYADCNALLDGGDAALEERYAPILPMLTDMAALAARLKKRRRLRGSLELESGETVIRCDGEGRPVGMELRRPGRAEGLIEEFMLCANETVARHLHRLGKPAVYRVHEKPSEDKARRLRSMLAPFGLEVRQCDSFSLQKALDAVRGRPEESAVNAILLRSLMKARYDGENLGHFGLAAPCYCHFTSPIRRYPDLMVHRILTALLEGRLHGSTEKKLAAEARRAAVQSSRRELAAQSAEREIEKLYMAEFMQAHVGETFSATVSGVTRFGLFALLPFGAEGLVPIEALPGGEYACDEDRMTLTGRDGTTFSFGMALQVVCTAADPGSGQIDFRLAGSSGHGPRPRPELPALSPKSVQKRGKRPPAPRRRKGRNRSGWGR